MNYLFNKNVFGLDISDTVLRLVRLKKIGKKLTIVSHNEVKLPANIITNGEIKNPEKLTNAINQLIKTTLGKKINTKGVIAVLPETKTFLKVIEIEATEKEKLPELVKEEIKNHIPLDLDETYLDWQTLSETNNKTTLLVGASPKTVVDSYASVLEKSGLLIYSLEIEAAAIVRSLIKEKTEKNNAAKIIIDFGANRTSLIVYDHQTIQFTVSLAISGNNITQTIKDTLNFDWEKAEKAKIVCGLDKNKCEGALIKILFTPIDNLINQIKKTIIFYKTNFSNGNPVTEIILCGGGANFLKIDETMSEKLKLSVTIGDPLAKVSLSKKIELPKTKIMSYATAIGLALLVWEK